MNNRAAKAIREIVGPKGNKGLYRELKRLYTQEKNQDQKHIVLKIANELRQQRINK